MKILQTGKLRGLLALLVFCATGSVSAHADCHHGGFGQGFGAGLGATIGLGLGAVLNPVYPSNPGWNSNPGFYNGAGVQVMSAVYGQNCGRSMDVAYDVQNSCMGQQSCWYRVDANRIGDPAWGCRKDFRVTYMCNGQVRSAYLMGEASGKTAALVCY